MENEIRVLTLDEIQRVVETLERADTDSLHAYQDALFQLRREVREADDPELENWVSFLAELYLVPLAAMDNLGVQQSVMDGSANVDAGPDHADQEPGRSRDQTGGESASLRIPLALIIGSHLRARQSLRT